MPGTLELPTSLELELQEAAERKGVAYQERATLLLYVAAALLRESGTSPITAAVRDFMEEHALDADRIASVLEELFDALDVSNAGNASGTEALESRLRAWAATRRQPTPSRVSARGKFAHLGLSSEEFAREKQVEIDREDRVRP